jgi:hypothetical protein
VDFQYNILSPKRYGFSLRSLLIGAVFIITLAVAVVIDVDAVLEYFSIISGSANSALEFGGIITGACAVPLLAMGMSIADDEMKRKT